MKYYYQLAYQLATHGVILPIEDAKKLVQASRKLDRLHTLECNGSDVNPKTYKKTVDLIHEVCRKNGLNFRIQKDPRVFPVYVVPNSSSLNLTTDGIPVEF